LRVEDRDGNVVEPARDEAGVSTVFLGVSTGVALPATLGTTDFFDLVFLVGRGVEAGGSMAFLRGAMLFDAREVSSGHLTGNRRLALIKLLTISTSGEKEAIQERHQSAVDQC